MLKDCRLTTDQNISDNPTFFWRLGKLLFTSYLSKRYVRCDLLGDFPKPPFLLLANHLSALDPFIISAFSPYPIHWVANRLIFQHPTLGLLIKAMGAIPKQKNYPDLQAVRKICEVVEQGGVVGLFPEGSVTWSGNFEGVMPGTSKLVKKLGVPVVVAKIKGAWLAQPVWAESQRKGPVEVEVSVHRDFPGEEALYHSEWSWQLERRFRYGGSNKARGIERVIWFCPECGTFRSVKALGETFGCFFCGARWVLDEHGFVEGVAMVDFMEVQKQKLSRFLSNQGFKVNNVLLSVRGRFSGRLKILRRGLLKVSSKGLEMGSLLFPWSSIRAENVFLKSIFEFLYADWLVRIHTNHSAFLLYSVLKEMKGKASFPGIRG